MSPIGCQIALEVFIFVDRTTLKFQFEQNEKLAYRFT